MTDTALVQRKLAIMVEHCRRAARRRPTSLEPLRADLDLQDALAMSLLVAIQEAIDIAFHICSDNGWGLPASNGEAFTLLSRNALIDAELAQALGRAAGLRYRLAHGYAGNNIDRLWTEIPAGLLSLDAFARRISAALG